MEDKILKEAYKLRFEYYNLYEMKQNRWHDKYKNHKLYETVKQSFEYDYKQIGQMMPKLIEKYGLSQ
ncbi:hypothetical protein CPU12_09320 [Malaciobacter molluscorum LMG 25693]|uniref:Uncharacterized protein n=1 Tax=Malaciobacter molluscorum LMG 25693 TaxID=870501 RepID=A0A2G1DGQ8_9BACT|nr:hypothetical protein [Malaciobacter molluscorum]AXX92500.1 hypothetical protein AMOL_1531 [Malaciobacter molluscorum LMG 25693]PHO17630.1 hypothetical protein CPU12_09320 [Malaciobacter molluscorum LMG 25693]